MSRHEDSVALVRHLYERLAAGDLAAVQTRLHPSFVLRATDSLPYGGRREGPSALAESMQGFLRCWKDPEFLLGQLTANDAGLVVAHIRLKVISHAGVAFSTEVLESWAVVDERVTALDVYYLNPEAALRAIRSNLDDAKARRNLPPCV